MAELKRFYSKSLRSYVTVSDEAKGELHPFYFDGKQAICTKAEAGEDGKVTAYITTFETKTKAEAGLENGVFEVNSVRVPVEEDMVLVLTDATATMDKVEEAEEAAAGEGTDQGDGSNLDGDEKP